MSSSPAAPPLRVEALVSGRLAASSRFRVLQHVEPLRSLGITVRARPPRISKYASVPPALRRPGVFPIARLGLRAAKLGVRLPHVARSWASDLTWLEREILPGARTLEPLLHRPLLFDVDDAIWLLSPGHDRATRAIAQRASCVVAGNDFLAEWFSHVAPAVAQVPTAVDTERFHPAPPHEQFVVGWSGTATTLPYLEALSAPLARVLAAVPRSRLLVVADAPPRLPEIPADRLEFVRWSPDTEANSVARMSVGLMPLPDTQWARGKCAFKMLQYMACGLPAVVSPIGMGSEILAMSDVGLAARNDDEWADALLGLWRDPVAARAMGTAGRAVAERTYAVPVVAARLADVMRRHA